MEDNSKKATKMIDVFYRCCLKRILGISWRDHITNEKVMTCSRQKTLHDIVAREEDASLDTFCDFRQQG